MSQQSFYKLTIPQIVADYQNGAITARGLLQYYFSIKLEEGWTMKIVPKEIIKVLGLTRSTFWRAINALRDNGFLDYEDPEVVIVKRLSQKQDLSQECDNGCTNATTIAQTRQPLHERNDAPEKPASDKDCSELIDSSIDSLKTSNKEIYISDSETENFEESENWDQATERLNSLSRRPKSKLTQEDKDFLKDQFAPFVEIWNENRYPTWAACQSLNDVRIDALLQLYREEGDRSLELFEKAVKQMAIEPYWQKIPATIDMLIRKTKGWVRALGEKYRETPTGHHISNQDIEDAQRLKDFQEFEQELEKMRKQNHVN